KNSCQNQIQHVPRRFSLLKYTYLIFDIRNSHSQYYMLFAGAAILSGASIPILSQTYLVWQLVLSAIFLKRRYRLNEITGCFLVTVGVVITVASGTGAGASLQSTGILWPLLMIISFFLQAADTVLKVPSLLISQID
uniref:Uncharacterized protein n=1 Tax=Aegilops tauschii subsp. strangulata TaxID=200361 RepID=A0A453GPT5_AEGTS